MPLFEEEDTLAHPGHCCHCSAVMGLRNDVIDDMSSYINRKDKMKVKLESPLNSMETLLLLSGLLSSCSIHMQHIAACTLNPLTV